MRQIFCPVCTEKAPPNQGENSLVACKNCGVSWTFIPNELDTDALYEDEVYSVVDNRNSIFERIIFFEAGRILSGAERLLRSNSRKLLDFGSGKGQFLWEALKRGWKGIGIETAKDRAQFARDKYKVSVLSEFYEGGKVKEGDFDLISLNHVLEHLPEPMKLLDELFSQNLKPGGIIYIEVPRANSWQAKMAGSEWMHWDIPKHLTHWTEPILLNEMFKRGYKIRDDRRFSVHLGVLGMLQAIFSFLGYRENLILGLKRKKSPILLFTVVLLSPIALLLETLACLFNRGGILGVYFSLDV
ncbi:class I SAM-dependent methyltransferase [Algoriphagus sediminis]|uniref:Class I SAM-dependent methyltransferase n=1 Tax=Algoriphagus sediminis TaxID=3057113 RepID=A0ABT7YC97_9BACT|nr:class I SAM-dependent methyltransferase [Algoriphagus sediminis]MDN3204152.1 class I SAM-dependent methyltransferase [Algoriphagus sediminis]